MTSPLTSVKSNLRNVPLQGLHSLTCNRLLSEPTKLSTSLSSEHFTSFRSEFHTAAAASKSTKRSEAPIHSEQTLQDRIILPPALVEDVDRYYVDKDIKFDADTETTSEGRTELIHIFDDTSIDFDVRNAEDSKIEIMQILATSMVDPKDFNKPEVRTRLKSLVHECSRADPEFILKAALYGRRELNLRTAPNLLLSLAFMFDACRPFTSKYFSAIVRLPSDWLSVVEMYKVASGQGGIASSLPTILKRNLISKFAEFDSYQLAKYNKNKRGGKRDSKNQEKKHVGKAKQACTLKYLIRYLHIHSPPFPVMCILGKRYPTGPNEFIQAGLEGDWDPSLAGTRMKLPQPMTWETVLSAEGNNAASWESLIGSGKLPYMAMLRNIRNILKAGVSPETHTAVCQKLMNPSAVIASKQLPFRFFSAYSVLAQMKSKLGFNSYLQRLGKQLKHRKKITISAKLKAAAANVRPCNYTNEMLQTYQQAINTAVEISVRNNVPPIRGSVLILCMERQSYSGSFQESCLHRDKRSVGVLLGLMCASASETCSMYMVHKHPTELVSLEEYKAENETLLSMARKICYDTKPKTFVPLNGMLIDLCSARQRFDTVFVLGPMHPDILQYVRFCRRYLGPITTVWSDLAGSHSWPGDADSKKGWFTVKGNTDMVLRYIAEASHAGLLARVDRIDEAYDLQDPPLIMNGRALSTALNNTPQIERPLSEWRCCRVFVSSTFRDMFAERDLICGVLLPSIRQFAARELHVHVNEVDLRWGVPESITHTSQALQLCFEQALKADLFILLVGNRYGWVPRTSMVSGLPPNILKHVKKFYEPGMSVTEMEYRLMKESVSMKLSAHAKKFGGYEKDYASRRIFVFLRDSSAIRDVPVEHLSEFSERKAKKQESLRSFREMLRSDGAVFHDNYPAFYNGVVGGHHVMGNLTELAKSLYRCLREALSDLYPPQNRVPLEQQSIAIPLHPTHEEFMALFVDPVASAIAPRQLLEVERAFNDLEARGKHCRSIRQSSQRNTSSGQGSRLSKLGHDGAVLLITGPTGCGKTTHIAALTAALHKPGWNPAQYRNIIWETTNALQGLSVKGQGSSSRIQNYPISQRPSLPPARVFVHFTQGLPLTGLPPSYSLSLMLNGWINRIVETFQQVLPSSQKVIDRILSSSDLGTPSTSGQSTDATLALRKAINHFHGLLKLLSYLDPMQFVFLIDDCDQLKPTSLDWLPDILPQNVRFAMTCDPSTSITRELTSRPDCLALTIRSLSYQERAAAIRTLFSRYGKILNESPCNNQVSVLVNKRGSELPFYLRLACDELRLHATYEQLDAQLRNLPFTVPTLIRHIVARTELQCGSQLTRATLGLICCSQQPLSAPELHALLDCYLSVDGPLLSFDALGWLELEHLTDDNEETSLLKSEHLIQSLLNAASKVVLTRAPRKSHLPPLAFQVLINSLRPLLAGLGDESEESDQVSDRDFSEDFLSEFAIIRFRSQDIENIVKDIVFNQTAGLSSTAIAGYHPIPSTSWEKAKVPRKEHPLLDRVCVTMKDIHWLLATTGDRLEHIIYYFFNSGRMNIVHRLLTSGVFVMEKFRAGFGSSIMEDFEGYGAKESSLQAEWSTVTQANNIADRLSSMKRFVATHGATLVKHPFMFVQLALNYSQDIWIRRLGFTLVELFKPDLLRQQLRLLVEYGAASSETDGAIVKPEAILDLTRSSFTTGPLPTSIALDPTGKLLACGTNCGNILIMDTSSFRILETLFGAGSAILSCCFIPLEESELSNISSNYWLAGTAQDGAVSLWELLTTTTTTGRLHVSAGARFLSLGECHVSAATCICWHPSRRILATGGLDCCVYLWSLPKSTRKLQKDQFQSNKSKVPFKCIRTGSARVSSVAVCRQSLKPSPQSDELPDVIAIGCWDGTVRIHDLDDLRLLKLLRASTWALTSLDFSPIDGAHLVTRDIKDNVCLWESNSFALVTALQQPVNPATCSRGRVCFSRPEGRYIIKSAGQNDKLERIELWTSQLGASLGPWRNCGIQRGVQRQVTAFTTDPLGHFAVSATDDGCLLFMCSLTGKIVRNHPIESTYTRVQAITCDISCIEHLPDEHMLLTAVGFSNGFVEIYTCKVECKGNLQTHLITGCSECSATPLVLQKKSDFHSENSVEHQMSPSGGVFCMSAANLVVASGGGNSSCGLYFCDYSGSVSEEFNVTAFHAAVTAVHVGQSYIVVGTKNRYVAVYQYDREKINFYLMSTLYHATDDWITALSILYLPGPIKADEGELTILVGSNDHAVRIYRISGIIDQKLLQTLNGPGGSITCLHSSGEYFAAGSVSGSVKIWRVTKSGKAVEVTSLDLTVGLNAPPTSSPITDLTLFKITDLERARVQKSTPSLSSSPTSEESKQMKSSMEMDDDELHTPSEDFSMSTTAECLPQQPWIPLSSESESENEPPQLVSQTGTTPVTDPHCLRMVVAQRYHISSDGIREQADGFRYRLFVPLLPECRAVLKGHMGAMTTGFASGFHPTDGNDALLVTMAESNHDLAACGGDLRSWRLPMHDLGYQPPLLTHRGSVTCLASLDLEGPGSHYLSGGTEADLILWKVPHCYPSSTTSSDWKPVVKFVLVKPDGPVKPIVAIRSAKCGRKLVVFAAFGCKIALFALYPDQLEHFSTTQVIHMQTALFMEDPVYSKFEFTLDNLPSCVVDLCTIKQGAAIEMVVSRVGGLLSIVRISDDSTPLAIDLTTDNATESHFPGVTMGKGDMFFSSSGEDMAPIGFYNKQAFLLHLWDKTISLEEYPAFDSFLSGHDRVDIISTILSHSNIRETWYLVRTVSANITRLHVLTATGLMVAQSEAYIAPNVVTAVSVQQDVNDPEISVIVVATSDGLLHILRYPSAKEGTSHFQKVGLCPTGECVTSLLVSRVSGILQVIAGFLSGSTKIYAIT